MIRLLGTHIRCGGGGYLPEFTSKPSSVDLTASIKNKPVPWRLSDTV